MKNCCITTQKILPLLLVPMLFGYSATSHSDWWQQGLETLKQWSDTPSNSDSTSAQFSNEELSRAFKQALSLGSESVVQQVGIKDGFNADQAIHIPLPDSLQSVASVLERVGMQRYTDDLELKLNRAAEAAAPEAKALFIDAISQMTFSDVQAIYQGADDAATQYLRSKTEAPLSLKMQPIIEQTLNEVGAIQSYDRVLQKYQTLPFVPDVKANLIEHTTAKGLDGIFYYLAKEEQKIRQDPVKQTTELLKKVFSNTAD